MRVSGFENGLGTGRAATDKGTPPPPRFDIRPGMFMALPMGVSIAPILPPDYFGADPWATDYGYFGPAQSAFETQQLAYYGSLWANQVADAHGG